VPDPIPVDDPADPRLADYVGLTDGELRRRREGSSGTFIAEGELVIRQLLRSPYPIRSVLLTPTRHRRLAGDLEGVDAPVYLVAPAVMQAVVGFDLHRGAVAAAGRLPLADPAELVAEARRLVVLEGLNDHENLGAVFRNAAAFGVDAILLSPTCADPLYRRSVRVSLGHVLRVRFGRLRTWPGDLALLRAAGWEIVAVTPAPPAEPVSVLGTGSGRVALVLGAEGPGLSEAVLAVADRRVRIPMAPAVDSLNVATAGAIALHHLAERDRPGR
jgi:tRNA G18 (ribose-2'-O)-methylase SpoU